ncbi:MAG: amino acid ABC transporter permease [Clostridiales bacterium]|nr:amino acid ABC transporter permease [Clostridiales bacterium]
MNWQFIENYLPLYQEAAVLTVRIGFMGIAAAILIGLVCTIVQYYKVPFLHTVVSVYIEVSRNTPLLIQLFFIYYGLPKIGIRTDADACGVAGLAFLGGSYMTEAFRSGIEAVPNSQEESAYSLGLSKIQTMQYVVLPQAFAISVPAFMANVIFLLKETSVFSAISLMDLMFTAKDLIGLYYKTTESLFLLVVFYLLILLPVSILGSFLERRLRYAGFGT